MKAWIRKSFKNQIFITVLAITLVPLLLCNVIMLKVQVKRINDDEYDKASIQLNAMSSSLEGLLSNLNRVTTELSSTVTIKSVLRNQNQNSRLLYQLLSQYTEHLRDMARFDICFKNGDCYYTTDLNYYGTQYSTDWGILKRAKNTSHTVYSSSNNTKQGMQIARAIKTYDDNILGYVLITIDEKNFDELFNSTYYSSGNVIVLDKYWETVYFSLPASSDTMIYGLRNKLINGEPLDDDNFTYSVARLESFPFYIILQLPLIFTNEALTTFNRISIAMGILAFTLCIIYALWLSKYLSAPIHELDEAMRSVKHGDFSTSLDVNREDELGRLAISFNKMTKGYKLNLAKSIERQKQLNKTQIRMMQAQLNPHFLYNTLDSIKWMGVENGIPQISTMTANLAMILRESISGEPFVTVENELNLIDKYLDIQYIRFDDRFVCEVDIDEKFQRCIIPRLSLQPIVENAIIHGVSDQDDGYIKITAYDENGDLILSVKDNGCGIPEDMLNILNSREKREPKKHFGLYNVDQIAKLNYGKKYGICVRTANNEGSEVLLRVPIRMEDNLC